MPYCSLCQNSSDPRLLAAAYDLRPAVACLIQTLHPDWQAAQGLCPNCTLRFAQMVARMRSPQPLPEIPLPIGSVPALSFPTYHAQEETLLSLPQRLAHHTGFTGQGVVLAFLDSGYYPHPDLTAAPPAPAAAPLPLQPGRLRAESERLAPRFVHYVDQHDGRAQEGLSLPSLWDGAGDSWHGEMTSALAIGNGRLSGGLYQAYAPEASILAIKIGRRSGRIPEEDILRGATWLLQDDNWQRFGVRVLNVSVGGDEPMPWEQNPVCLAMEALSERGVLVVAAAGNSDRRRLLAPAQAPSVLTVGGVDDGNRLWSRLAPHEVGRLRLYHHNWGETQGPEGVQTKPDLVAPANWLPAPVLPASPVLVEMVALAQLWDALTRGDGNLHQLLTRWQSVLRLPADQPRSTPLTLAYTLRARMAQHKWIHPYYQHVDGTSTAAPLVAAVAAQMVAANPALTPADLRRLLLETAMPLPHLSRTHQGAGLLQPTLAVAAALRAPSGPLAGYPLSATQSHGHGLPKRSIQGRVAATAHTSPAAGGVDSAPAYFGLLAPAAHAVSVIGPFNGWQPGADALVPAVGGWWHLALSLPAGRHPYRFWVEDQAHPTGHWMADPENPARQESGYREAHSVVHVV